MLLICSVCKKEFNINETQEKLFLLHNMCYECRRRFGGTCVSCGKNIGINSKLCKSCSQLGDKNPIYKTGLACKNRTCSICGKSITSGSKKGLCRSCYTKQLNGKANPNYRHGHFTDEFESSLAYKNWKLNTFRNDGFKCAICGNSKSGNLQAHHIYPKRDYPAFALEPTNGITLCKQCHKQTFSNEYDYIPFLLSKKLFMPYQNSVNSVNGEIPNTEPSQRNLEGVETRDAIKFSTSAGERSLTRNEDIVQTYGNKNHKKSEIKSSDVNKLMIIDNAQGIHVIGSIS